VSDAFGPGGPGGPGGPDQEPSEEEVRAYLGQLRGAPAEQVVAEVLSALLNAAQVKLGRRDGRLLLDLSASVVDGAREHLPAEFLEQVDGVLSQLRVTQVEAEREVASATEQGHEEPNDLGAPRQASTGQAPGASAPGGDAPAAPTPPPAASPQQEPPSGGSRLWVPGR
jgi:hypothetical protein